MANFLSVFRILIVPPLLYSLYIDDGQPSLRTLALFVIGLLSDAFDGLVARHLDQSSRLGKVLDPVADKIFIGSLLCGLMVWRGLPVWLLVLQLVRDGLIVTGGIALLRRDVVPKPSIYGKAATACMGLVLLIFLVAPEAKLAGVLVWGAAALLLLSGFDYARTFWGLFFGSTNSIGSGTHSGGRKVV